jgi:hypothetical protein
VASAPVLELMLVKPADQAAFSAAQTTFHDDHLEAADTVVAHLPSLGNPVIGVVASSEADAGRPNLRGVSEYRSFMR